MERCFKARPKVPPVFGAASWSFRMADGASKFEPFTLKLANSATLSGIAYVPSLSTLLSSRPLLVLFHGGGCHAGYYDVDSNHSAAEHAEAFSLPVVSINRPCYQQTSSLFPIPAGSSFHKETGRWEHRYIFPALWEAYGIPNQCTAIVAMGHSLATPGLLVATSLHAQTTAPSYPLAGLVLSGWGVAPRIESQQARLHWTKEESRANRHLLMLSDPSLNAAEPSMKDHLSEQTVEPPAEEAQECVVGPWSTYFPDIAAEIKVPIMFGLGEHDWLWEGTKQHVSDFEAFFPQCERFRGILVQGAPHAIEWSYRGREWYAGFFDFALEVSKAKQS